VQQGEAKDALGLRQCLDAICNEHISLQMAGAADTAPWQMPAPLTPDLQARHIERVLSDDWRVTSYSGLQQHGQALAQDLMPRLDVDAAGVGEVAQEPELTPHQFPRGASPGTFLHSLFEELDFTQPVSEEWVADVLQKGGYDASWNPVLKAWIARILHAPLNDEGISLSQLTAKEKQVEMEFYLPISGPLTAVALDALIRQYDPLSQGCPPLEFRQVRGMLKGFIDLVFRHNGRYYLLDYKSNWLGENREAYTQQAMALAMQSHRYDLQYQLYTLALHRYLRHRIADYDYQRHFGGVIYLFLRGVDGSAPGSGIFSTRPDEVLINKMDSLFAGTTEEVVQ
jgi:exodeoxyribonuclease V beta subunit